MTRSPPGLQQTNPVAARLDSAVSARIAEQLAKLDREEAARKQVSWGNQVPRDIILEAAGAPDVMRRRAPSELARAAKPLNERLFDKAAALKGQIARVAMHLDPEWRAGLFENLDRLLDPEEWEFDESDYPTAASFNTFLRMAIFLGDIRRPGLGMSGRGTIVAVWMRDRDKLTVDCLADDKLRWVFTTHDNDERESVAGETTVKKLREILRSVNPGRWFER